MEGKVTIQCPELAAAISKLADAIASKTTLTAALAAPASAAPQFETFAPVPAPTDQDAPPWAVPTPAAPAPVPAPAAPAPTTAPVVDAAYRSRVATAAARLIEEQNKMAEVLKALEECGAQAVTQLDANSMPLFVQKITALGAVI